MMYMCNDKNQPDDGGLLRQIFSIPVDKGNCLIYAPLKQIAFVANGALVNSIFNRCVQNGEAEDKLRSSPVKRNDDSISVLQYLDELGFFIPEPLPVDEYLDRGVMYDSVVLFLTNQCNLRCRYCYASSGEYQKKQMTWEIAKAAIDFVLAEVLKNGFNIMTLGFHGGGEPTMNWDVLTKAVDYAHSKAKENNILLKVSGAFNGYWTNKVRQYVIENFTEISVSFDGISQVQNFQRPSVIGEDSFEKVTDTLHALDEAGFPYGIRMTVTNYSVDFLSESIEYICKNFKPRKVQVEPAFEQGRALKSDSIIKNLDVFIYQFIKAYKIAQNYGIDMFYSGARPDVIIERFCLAACSALVVTTDGDITTCFESYGREHPLSKYFIIGSYTGDGNFSIDEEKLNMHFSHNIDSNPNCINCFCKWHCAGDCTIKTISGNDGQSFNITERCLITQELTKYLILKKIKESGGIIFDGREENENRLTAETMA